MNGVEYLTLQRKPDMESYEESSEDDMISTNDSVSSESSRCLYIDSFEKYVACVCFHS